MQGLIEGGAALKLLFIGKHFIARARCEERAMKWKGAACCYVNAARQLSHLPGQTERRAKALGRAGLCFERSGDLDQAAACYQNGWRLCVFLGEEAARDCLWQKGKIVQQKIYHRRANHAYMRDVQKEAEGQAVVVLQKNKQTRTVGCGCEDGELRAVDRQESRLDADGGREEDVLGDTIPTATSVQVSRIQKSDAAALCAPLPQS